MMLGLGALGAVVGVGVVAYQNRDRLGEVASVGHEGERWVVRLDANPVPPALRRAAWGLVAMGLLGAVWPAAWFTPESVAPAVGVAWLAGLLALVTAFAAYREGWLWPAPSRRLGLGSDEVWWDAIDRHQQPDLGPTSVATRVPRSEAALSLDGEFAVVTTSSGRGVVFGPLPDDLREALQARWAAA